MTRRRASVLAASLAIAALLTGCASGLSEDGEPLDAEQAEALAQTRFQLSTTDEFGAEITVGAADDVDHYVVHATVSHDDGVAWGTLERGPEGLAVSEQIAFGSQTVAIDAGSGWQVSALEGQYAELAVVFSLVADRPENSELLRQSDARFLGVESSDDVEYEVYRLPSDDGAGATTRMWLNEGRLGRLDDGGDEFVVAIKEAAGDERPEGLLEMLGAGADE
ncbi:hypothetical protein [Microbacterium halotolerans]|uniref:hypothetical protein n=1 Tax=Microbacterium halotolerans TaxID=246613 RepID=UPI000E6AC95B|nr:hypothetical protein [Microbacterium halotolerans]